MNPAPPVTKMHLRKKTPDGMRFEGELSAISGIITRKLVILSGLGQQLTLNSASNFALFWSEKRITTTTRGSSSEAGLGGQVSAPASQLPFVGCAGRAGGFCSCGDEKLKNSIMLSAFPSRAVRGGNPKR